MIRYLLEFKWDTFERISIISRLLLKILRGRTSMKYDGEIIRSCDGAERSLVTNRNGIETL